MSMSQVKRSVRSDISDKNKEINFEQDIEASLVQYGDGSQ